MCLIIHLSYGVSTVPSPVVVYSMEAFKPWSTRSSSQLFWHTNSSTQGWCTQLKDRKLPSPKVIIKKPPPTWKIHNMKPTSYYEILDKLAVSWSNPHHLSSGSVTGQTMCNFDLTSTRVIPFYPTSGFQSYLVRGCLGPNIYLPQSNSTKVYPWLCQETPNFNIKDNSRCNWEIG